MSSTAADDQRAADRDAVIDELAQTVEPMEWRGSGYMLHRGHTITWSEYVQRRHELEDEASPCMDCGSTTDLHGPDCATHERDVTRPHWDDAPCWARWLAQDADGVWHWYQDRPEIVGDGWHCDSGALQEAGAGLPNAGWRATLVNRLDPWDDDTSGPALDKASMLEILASELEAWPEDCIECERTEPTGWGWRWYDVPPDCESVLGVPGALGDEWRITEAEWRAARWGKGEERIDRIAQSDASGEHYDAPPVCADGLPCGVRHSPGDDAYCLRCPHEPVGGEPDAINPDHYRQGQVECIDALAAATVGKTGIEAVCVANIIKYLWRYELKNGVEDVKKSRWYLDRLIRELES